MTNYFINFLKTIKVAKKIVVPTEYVVMFDGFGKSLNPTGNIGKNVHTGFWNYENESDDEFSAHLKLIDNEMDAFYASQPIDKNKKKILVFIHGGLNTQVKSLERIVESCEDDKSRCELIKEAGYYPIFINWRSSLFYCYWEHLAWLRQGKTVDMWKNPFKNPFSLRTFFLTIFSLIIGVITLTSILLTDISRAVSRSLIVIVNLILNDAQTIPLFRTSHPDDVAKELTCRRQNKDDADFDFSMKENNFKFKKPPICWLFNFKAKIGSRPTTKINKYTFPIEIGEDERNCCEMTKNFLMWLITLPFKMFSAIIIDAFGTSSWEVMLRHIDLLFNIEDEFIESDFTNNAKAVNKLADIPRSGGLSLFIEALIKKTSTETPDDWEITLVGHSMGTIVANKIIRLFGDKLPINKIIYLASADTLENYEETIYPYLLRNKGTEIKHLMLHPRAEEGETNAFDIFAPRGSLLVWLDSFLSKPLTLMERTVGRYDNLIPALHNAPQTIRRRISVCVFSAGEEAKNNNPQTHSDVAGRVRYWTL